MQALKKFMTLGQGDFVTCLMDMIGPVGWFIVVDKGVVRSVKIGWSLWSTLLIVWTPQDLGKRCDQVYRHDLTGKLEAALRSSNAQVSRSIDKAAARPTALNLASLVAVRASRYSQPCGGSPP